MGTTLTGTTPQDTYDSLIKVTDNGPIGATAKLLTDGLGNDSVLYLGTAGLGIKSTSVLSFNVNDATHSVGYDSVIDGSQLRGQNGIRFGTGSGSGTERMRITSAGNVGIGTSSPSQKLSVNGVAGVLGGNQLRLYRTDNAIYGSIQYLTGAGGFKFDDANSDGYTFAQAADTRLAITSTGNVGIGTTSPATKLDVNGNISTSGDIILTGAKGIFFDNAASKYLDDYEEGTWTPAISFGGASVGVTYSSNAARYTKVGNQVTLSCYITMSSKGSSTGLARIGGLPFTVGGAGKYSAVSLWWDSIAYTGQLIAYTSVSSTVIEIYQTSEAGVMSSVTDANFNNDARIMINVTYFV